MNALFVLVPFAAMYLFLPKRSRRDGARSWLDCLQKEAHARELDHTNTSNGFFVLLSTLVTGASLGASSLLSPRFTLMAGLGLGSHWFGFLKSLALGSNMWFDVTEDIAYFGMLAYNFVSIEGEPSPRQRLAHACALLWCTRLLAFLGYRIVVRGSDWRFDKLILEKGYNFFGWTCGGAWCWANGFALWMLADVHGSADAAHPLGWLEAVGAAIFLMGLGCETLSDIQKHRFKSRPGTKGRFIDEGLWSISRHPNYVGEISNWVGITLICCGGALGAHWRSVALAWVTPAWSAFFLVFTSMMLLEKRGDARWGGQPDYEAYKRRTPVLFPLLT